METTYSQNIKIGVFVSLGLVATFFTIFMLGGNSNLLVSQIKLYAEFEQTQGLNKGSIVSLSGITVGNVKNISFDSTRNVVVIEMRIQKDFEKQIQSDSQIEVRTQGALGDKYLFISPGQPGGKLISDGDYLQVARGNDIMSILSSRANESEKIFDILNETLILVRTLNKESRLEKIISNFEKTSQDVRQTAKNLTEFNGLSSIASSALKLDQILGKIERGEGTLGALINDPTLHNQAKKLLGGYQRQMHLRQTLRSSIENAEE